MNAVTITGNIKNVQLRGKSERKVLTGNLVQTGIINEWGKVGCIATMPLVFLDEEIAKQAQALPKDDNGASETVKISGRIITRFDRRPGVDNAERYAPYTQIEVQSIA